MSDANADSLARVVVVGTSCAGKTTFARSLAARLGRKHIELDELHWGPDWQPKATEEFRRLLLQATGEPAWVADGNYSVIRDLLWPRATTIVWLNYSYPRVLWRAVTRTVIRSLGRKTLWHGNRETIGKSFFSRDSILWWVIRTHYRRRRNLQELRANGNFPHLRWIEFQHPKQAQQWLASDAAKRV